MSTPAHRRVWAAHEAVLCRREGMTYKQTAQTLNRENTPTPSGRGQWHISSVKELLQTPTAAVLDALEWRHHELVGCIGEPRADRPDGGRPDDALREAQADALDRVIDAILDHAITFDADPFDGSRCHTCALAAVSRRAGIPDNPHDHSHRKEVGKEVDN